MMEASSTAVDSVEDGGEERIADRRPFSNKEPQLSSQMTDVDSPISDLNLGGATEAATTARTTTDTGTSTDSVQTADAATTMSGSNKHEKIGYRDTHKNEDSLYTVFVRDPLKIGIISPYIQYTVVSSFLTTHEERSVLRRYTDFCWLHERITSEHQFDCDIPLLPSKQTIGRFDDAFIELRRQELETYLRKLSTEPVLASSFFTALFFLANNDLMAKKEARINSKAARQRILSVLLDRPLPKQQPLVLVSDPNKIGYSIPFIKYKVTTSFLTNGVDKVVLRRYSDFEWLHTKLWEEYPSGYGIPELPAKQASGRFDPSFLETRRAELQEFINDLLYEPSLSRSVHTVTFLVASDDVFSRRDEPYLATAPTTSSPQPRPKTLHPQLTQRPPPPPAEPLIRVIEFRYFKSASAFPEFDRCYDQLVDISNIDIANSFLVYVSHNWMHLGSGPTKGTEADTSDNKKHKLCVSGIDALWQSSAPDMANCYVWLDLACLAPTERANNLVDIMRCMDAVFTPVVGKNSKLGETIVDWLVDYKAEDWNGHPQSYVFSKWCRLEMFCCSNVPLINPALKSSKPINNESKDLNRVDKFIGSMRHYISLDMRPHVMYGSTEMSLGKSPIFLDPLSNIFYDKYDPEKGMSSTRDVDEAVMSVINHLRPYLKSVKAGYEGGRKFTYFGPKHGIGVEVFSNGDVYKGDFEDDMRHGTGVYKYCNGNIYDGDWRGGDIHGRGKMRYANGNEYYGDWDKNARTGSGLYKWANGNRYEGELVNAIPNGIGKFSYVAGDPFSTKLSSVLTLGSTYMGQFQQGQREGPGCVVYPDGRRVYGLWKEGLLLSETITEEPQTSASEESP